MGAESTTRPCGRARIRSGARGANDTVRERESTCIIRGVRRVSVGTRNRFESISHETTSAARLIKMYVVNGPKKKRTAPAVRARPSVVVVVHERLIGFLRISPRPPSAKYVFTGNRSDPAFRRNLPPDRINYVRATMSRTDRVVRRRRADGGFERKKLIVSGRGGVGGNKKPRSSRRRRTAGPVMTPRVTPPTETGVASGVYLSRGPVQNSTYRSERVLFRRIPSHSTYTVDTFCMGLITFRTNRVTPTNRSCETPCKTRLTHLTDNYSHLYSL